MGLPKSLRAARGEGNPGVAYGKIGHRAGPVIRQVVVPAPRAEVWLALTRLDLLGAWLGEVVEMDPRAGGAVIVREPDGSTRRGLVERVDPGRELVFRWRRLAGVGPSLEVGDASRVAFELEDEASGTRLTVTEEPAPLVAMGAGS